MTALFRFKRDDSRWKFFCLTGISLIGLTYLPSISLKRAEGSSKATHDPQSDTIIRTMHFTQVDDLFRQGQPLPALPRQAAINRDRTPHPQMTSLQIEAARARLIRRGFSPIEADTLLPTGSLP